MNPSKKLKSYQLQARCGQSLVEIMIALAIGGLIVGSAVVALVLSLKSGTHTQTTQSATQLMSGLIDSVRSVADGDWNTVYIPPGAKGEAVQYKIVSSGTPPVLDLGAGAEEISANNITYTRWFSIANVCRDNLGRGSISGITDSDGEATTCTVGGDKEDPSTQKIVATITTASGTTLNVTEYIVRSKNSANLFTDWSGGLDTSNTTYTSPTNNYSAIYLLNVSNSGEISLPAVETTGNITSVTYDTGKSANYNSIIWRGSSGNGTVSFQLATSDSSNPTSWDFKGPGGTNDPNDLYSALRDMPAAIVGANHKNQQYYRYKVFLTMPTGGTSPQVEDIIVNWSP